MREVARLGCTLWWLGAFASGCGSATLSAPPQAAPVRVVSGAPLALGDLPGAEVTMAGTPARVARYASGAAVEVDGAITAVFPGGQSPLRLTGSPQDPTELGQIRALAPRGSAGLWVLAAGGLFHTAEGALLRSPLSESLGTAAPTRLASLGEGATEEVWFTAGDELLWATAGRLTAARIEGAGPFEQLAIAAPGVALAAAGGAAYRVDLAQGEAAQVADGLGQAYAAVRGDDGTTWLATEGGLLSLAPDGAATLRTFAAEGAPAARVVGVQAGPLGVYALAGGALLRLEGDGAARVAEGRAERGDAFALDGAGDTLLVEGAALRRVLTSTPVPFSEVVTFFEAHCTTCHADGGRGPKRDFTSHAWVSASVDNIVHRLQSTGSDVMPPASQETLTPDDYEVVLRWIITGKKP